MFDFLATAEQLPGWMLITLGFFFAFRVIRFPDLTVDASFAMGSVCAVSSAIAFEGGSWIAICLSIVAGCFAGSLTWLIFRLHPEPSFKLLSGLLVSFASYSIAFRVFDGRPSLGVGMSPTASSSLYELAPEWTLNPFLLVGLTMYALAVSSLVILWSRNIGLQLRTVGTRPSLLHTFRTAPGGRSSILLSHDSRAWSLLLLGLLISNSIIAAGGWYIATLDGNYSTGSSGVVLHGLAATLLGEVLWSLARRRKKQVSSISTVTVSALIAVPVLGTIVYYFVKVAIAIYFGSTSGGDFSQTRINAQDQNMLVTICIIIVLVLYRYTAAHRPSLAKAEEADEF